jgi:hypothetical protein
MTEDREYLVLIYLTKYLLGISRKEFEFKSKIVFREEGYMDGKK